MTAKVAAATANTSVHFSLMCQVRTNISSERITDQDTVGDLMISPVATVIECEDIEGKKCCRAAHMYRRRWKTATWHLWSVH